MRYAASLPALFALLVGVPAAASSAVDAGRALYEKGERGAGEAIRAVGPNGVMLSGSAAACVNCHRRSGLGGSEGQSTIRPITGRHLFSPPEVPERPQAAAVAAPREPYTREGFARAVREGVAVDGRELDRLMPRYALEDDEVAALHAYLDTLGTAPVPGVGAREIHFATIVGPGVDAATRRAMLDVFDAAVRERNAGTRNEARRRDVGDRMARAYRTWVLHVWELQGAPETWGRQLAAHYRRQPVFAVLGGTAGGSWAPVHGFCEQERIPCLFPDVDHPGGEGHYSLYFSKGVALEAEVLAAHLAESRPSGPIVQVYRDDAIGRLAADALRGALTRRGIDVLDQPAKTPRGGKGAFWRAVLTGTKPGALVVWDAPETLVLGEKGEPPPARLDAIYVSASLGGSAAPALPERWQGKLRVVSPFVLPGDRDQHLARLRAWLAARSMPLAVERAQANAFFAVSVAGDALAHIGENITRDYFIERIEQMAGTPLFPSMYPHLSLGPGQRFASRGAYILGLPQGPEGPWVPVRNWTVP